MSRGNKNPGHEPVFDGPVVQMQTKLYSDTSIVFIRAISANSRRQD